MFADLAHAEWTGRPGLRALTAPENQQMPRKAFLSLSRIRPGRIQKCPANRRADHAGLSSIKELHGGLECHKNSLHEWRHCFICHSGIGVRFEDHPGNPSQKRGHQHSRAGIAAYTEHKIGPLFFSECSAIATHSSAK